MRYGRRRALGVLCGLAGCAIGSAADDSEDGEESGLVKLRTATIGSAGGLRLPKLDVGAYELVLLDTSIVHNGSVASGWTNRSQFSGRDGTASGSPAVDTSTQLTGIVLDGVDDYITGNMSLAADAPLTFFIVSTPQAQASARYTILALTDNGAAERCSAAVWVFTNRTAHAAELDDAGNAGFVDSATVFNMHRYDFRLGTRSLLANGIPRVGNALPLVATRAPTQWRIGASFANSNFNKATIYEVIIVSGDQPETKLEQIQAAIQRYVGLPRTPQWAPSSISIGSDDPNILLFDSEISVVLGEPLLINRATVDCLSNAANPLRDGTIPQTLTAPGQVIDDSRYDRWVVTPPAAGTYNIQLAEANVSQDADVVVVDPLAGGAPMRRIVLAGDSNTARGWWVQFVGDYFGARATLLGTRGPNAGYGYKHQGQDGFSFFVFNSDIVMQGTVSPFWTGGVLDMYSYMAAIGGSAPDFIVWALMSNYYPTTPTDATLEADITQELAQAEILLAAASECAPGISQILMSPEPGNGDPVVWGNELSRLTRRRICARATQRLHTQFASRTAERYYLESSMAYRFDNWRGYPGQGFPGEDPVHMNAVPGHQQISKVFIAALTRYWNTPNVLRMSSVSVQLGTPDKLRISLPETCNITNTNGLSLTYTSGTPRTITGIDSGSGTSNIVLNLSGDVAGGDVFRLNIGSARTITAAAGGRKLSGGYMAVTVS